MQEQNFKNHSRLVPLYHYWSSILFLAILIGAIINICESSKENLYSATLILALTIFALLLMYFSRAFALKAQDRAIRSEENFRHYLLTGKVLDNNLSMSQIIALRFASDEEFPKLAAKAVQENLSSKDIKQSITNWKADYNRV